MFIKVPQILPKYKETAGKVPKKYQSSREKLLGNIFYITWEMQGNYKESTSKIKFIYLKSTRKMCGKYRKNTTTTTTKNTLSVLAE